MQSIAQILSNFIEPRYYGDIYSISRVNIYGCSFTSKFIPVFAMFKSSGSLFLEGKEIIYHHLYADNREPLKKSYNIMYSTFCYGMKAKAYRNKDGIILIRKGLVTDENFNIKMSLCFKDFKNIDKDNITIKDFILIVNKQYFNSLLFKNFNKKNCFKDIDMLLTDNVEEYCFKSPKIIPKFKDIAVMQQYLNDVNKLLL